MKLEYEYKPNTMPDMPHTVVWWRHDIPNRDQTLDAVLDWLCDNFGVGDGSKGRWTMSARRAFFRDKTDAMHFKLIWDGTDET